MSTLKYFYLYPSDDLSLFQLILIVRSCVVLLHHCLRLGEGWDPATFCMYVPVPSQETVIHWLSFVDVLHICFSFIFFLVHIAVSFLV